MYWERDGDGLGDDSLRAPRAARPGAARGPRELAPGRRLRPLGGQAAADRARVGGGRGRRRPPSAPTSTTSASAAPRPAPTPTAPPTAARCRCSATSGSGPPRTSPATPDSAPSPTRSTRRSSSATRYKVLRGGAWATRRDVIRPSFRNWDLPERSQIFSGAALRKGRIGDNGASRSRSRFTCRRAARSPAWPRTCARGSRARSRSCRRSTSTTSAARSCSRRSPSCPSTTRPGSSARSSTASRRRSSPPPARRR